MKRKLLSVLLTFCLAFSLLPTAALADEGEGGDAAPAAANGNVAKIGGTEYTTLAEAITAVENNGTIELLTDVNNAKGMRVDTKKTFTVDFKGHTYTVSKPGAGSKDTETNAFQLITGQNITFKNGTICLAEDNLTASVIPDTSPAKYSNIRRVIQCYAALTLEDMTIDATNVFGSAFPMSFNNQPVNITGNTSVILKPGTTTAFDADGNWGPYGRCTVTVNTTGTIDGDLELGSGYLDIKNVKANGVHFCTSCGPAETTDQIKRISITGGTFTTDVSAYVAEGYVQNENGTVEQLGETNAVAKVGNTYYKTLAEAVTAAKEAAKTDEIHSATITLLKNTELAAEVTLDGNDSVDNEYPLDISIDLNNRTLDIKGFSFTIENGAVLEIFDGRIDSTPKSTTTAAFYVNAESSCLLDNVTMTTTGVAVFARGDGALAAVNNSNITAGTYAVATNAESSDNYNPVFNIVDSTLKGLSPVLVNVPCELNIKNSTINGSMHGVIVRGGTANITGSTITQTYTDDDYQQMADYFNERDWGSGNMINLGALIVGNKHATSYQYPSDVTVTDTVIKTAGAHADLFPAIYTYANNAADKGVNLSIGGDKTNVSGKVVKGNEEHNTITVTGGLFSSDPDAYVAAGHYVDASNNGDYPYTVKVGTKPAGALIVVKDATDVTVPDSEAIKGLTTEDKTNISQNTKVDGVAEAVAAKKDDLIPKSVDTSAATKVEVEVSVKVEVKSADLSGENGAKTLTFEAKPVATIKVDGTEKATDVAVPNSLLSGDITVKLPLPADFTPEQIKHISSDGSVEYFLKTAKRGAKTFEIKDGCAVFTVTKFSTFELSGVVTYVEPSYSSGSSSYDPTYSVSTPSKTEHGGVTVSPKSASKGDTVTVTVKPDSGYVLETLTVTDKNGNELTLKDKGNGKYTFTMPAGKVEVKATFMEDNSMLNFFYDVPNDAYFYEAVKWAVENGITTGVGNDLFAPEQPCTRAQIVTFLWRAAGSPEPKGAASGMTDVVSGSYYEKAVAWAIENGITTGTTTSTFSPDATCTRAQAVTFLARALKAKAASAAEFSDVPNDSYFADAVAWAAANGVTEGIGGGLFGSDNDCTRGQIVTFLYRAYNK